MAPGMNMFRVTSDCGSAESGHDTTIGAQSRCRRVSDRDGEGPGVQMRISGERDQDRWATEKQTRGQRKARSDSDRGADRQQEGADTGKWPS
jgi:hypothetical protein